MIKHIVRGSAVLFVVVVIALIFSFKRLGQEDQQNTQRIQEVASQMTKVHHDPDKPLAGPMQQKKEVVVYTTPTCPYCHEAKDLLDRLRIRYVEKNVMESDHRAAMMRDTRNARSVPQIVIGGEHIGGFYELSQMVEEGLLVDKVSGR